MKEIDGQTTRYIILPLSLKHCNSKLELYLVLKLELSCPDSMLEIFVFRRREYIYIFVCLFIVDSYIFLLGVEEVYGKDYQIPTSFQRTIRSGWI